MAGMNGAGGPMGAMPMMNNMVNGVNGATPRPGGESEDSDYEGRLNAYIYDYFVRKEHFDCARALVKSGIPMAPALRGRDNDVNGADNDAMQNDSKDDADSKRPDDLPPSTVSSNAQDPPFLLEWFALFWDVYAAQRRKTNATAHAMQYVQHTQVRRYPTYLVPSLNNVIGSIQDADRSAGSAVKRRNARYDAGSVSDDASERDVNEWRHAKKSNAESRPFPTVRTFDTPS